MKGLRARSIFLPLPVSSAPTRPQKCSLPAGSEGPLRAACLPLGKVCGCSLGPEKRGCGAPTPTATPGTCSQTRGSTSLPLERHVLPEALLAVTVPVIVPVRVPQLCSPQR